MQGGVLGVSWSWLNSQAAHHQLCASGQLVAGVSLVGFLHSPRDSWGQLTLFLLCHYSKCVLARSQTVIPVGPHSGPVTFVEGNCVDFRRSQSALAAVFRLAVETTTRRSTHKRTMRRTGSEVLFLLQLAGLLEHQKEVQAELGKEPRARVDEFPWTPR